MKPVGLGAAAPGVTSGVASILASASAGAPASTPIHDSPMLTQQIRALQTALRAKSLECSKLRGAAMMKELKSLHPLKPASPPKPSNEIRKIQSELSKLEENLTNLVIVPVIDISRRKAGPYPVGSHSPLEALK
uniref:Uncharacterized protein n=1 Tax=Ciona savignyi TaxID=51511 RepID=H2Y6D8_CIOSA